MGFYLSSHTTNINISFQHNFSQWYRKPFYLMPVPHPDCSIEIIMYTREKQKSAIKAFDIDGFGSWTYTLWKDIYRAKYWGGTHNTSMFKFKIDDRY